MNPVSYTGHRYPLGYVTMSLQMERRRTWPCSTGNWDKILGIYDNSQYPARLEKCMHPMIWFPLFQLTEGGNV